MDETEIRVVDNRTFLLGLDFVFRKNQKKHEAEQLAPAAEKVLADLDLPVADMPIEGYYGESPELARYFAVIRTIAPQRRESEARVSDKQALAKLVDYAGSPIFGSYSRAALLPSCTTPLDVALSRTYPDWTVERITGQAQQIAAGSGDFSLVGLACLAGDPVAITATRETTVLYAQFLEGARLVKIEYRWEVDPELQIRANKLIQEFARVTGLDMPAATPENAAKYYHLSGDNRISGRCVAIGKMQSEENYYHWAIDLDSNRKWAVNDFWESRIVTTDEYRARSKQAN